MNKTISSDTNILSTVLIFSEYEQFALGLNFFITKEYEALIVISFDEDNYENLISQILPSLIIINSHTRAHLINKIKANQSYKKIPLFYMSMSASYEDIKLVQCDEFLPKPLDLPQFFSKINEHTLLKPKSI